jgi:NADPH2:quinone reductase
MRAIWYDRTGPAREVLVLGERPKPAPGPREALIRIEASGVNPSDVGLRGGVSLPMPYPRVTPNSDGAGVVEAVGHLVPASLIGKRVWFYNGQRNGRAFGTAAEYIELDAELLRALPDDISFAEGATLGIPAMTAHVCLFMAGPVQGRTVLVTGGAGAVGHYAVQLAKWAGASVIATVSSDEKAQRALAGGADHVIDYRREDVTVRLAALAPEGIDHVVDVDFGGNFGKVFPALKMGGTVAFYATRGDLAPRVPALDLMRRNIALFGMVLPASAMERRRRAQDDITRWIGTGKRMLSVAGTWPLADTAGAHEAVERGDKVGTVVVEVQR